MSNIPIWPGSSSFAQVSSSYYVTGSWPPPTPFGFYDTDSEFQTDANKVANFCALRLGYPIEKPIEKYIDKKPFEKPITQNIPELNMNTNTNANTNINFTISENIIKELNEEEKKLQAQYKDTLWLA